MAQEHLPGRAGAPEPILPEVNSGQASETDSGVLHGVIDAFLTVVSGLELQATLHRIVTAAADLVDAQYGALGVLDTDGGLAEFVYVGIDAQTFAAIGPLPSGHGLVGLLIEHPHVMRLADLTTHPASVGFPPGHPMMHSFIGAPIRVRDQVFGNLYLTEKRGGSEFTEQDEMVLRALASAAGAAVENARLYEEVRRRERWLLATAQIRAKLLSGTTVADALQLIAERATDLIGADGALVLIADEAGGLQVRAAVGMATLGVTEPGADRSARIPTDATRSGAVDPEVAGSELIGRTMPADDPWTRMVVRTAGSGEATDLPTPGDDLLAAVFAAVGPQIVAPVPGGSTDGGVLICLRAKGSNAFHEERLPLLIGLAEQGSLALEVSDRVEQRRRYELLAERERIARDLHDHVIQRLFGVGLSLQGQESRTSDPRLRERLEAAVQQVDEAIRDLRSSIFDLRAVDADRPRSLRRRLLDIAAGAGDGGMTVEVRIDGPIDTLVPPDLAGNAEAVVREAVSNAVRHSGGNSVTVLIGTAADELTIEVSDNGAGIPSGAPHRGLHNLAQRAESCGGSFAIGLAATGGARLRWVAPLPAE